MNFIAPDEIIKEPLTDYYAMGINDIEITKHLPSRCAAATAFRIFCAATP
jgi:hypothetical protein